MRKQIDESKILGQLIKFLSNSLARQRGLVPVIGIGLVVVGLLVLLLNVIVDVAVVEFIGLLLQGVGVIAALAGLLLAEPLGK